MGSTTTSTTLTDQPGSPTDNPTPETGSTGEPLTAPEQSSPPLPASGRTSSIQTTARTAASVEIIKALAVIQDGLRLFALAGGLLKPPFLVDNRILVLAMKLRGHTLGVGPEGNFVVDGISVMEGRGE